QRLVPSIRGQDLVAARAGVRAQALARDGQLVDDFRIRTDECIVNVDNAPSPAATSSLNIGRLVAETLAQQI
ncbi:MAG: L-2-hydroxyglutarate oxidase, partial [Planctomycetota bacterium]|nr:L-2-hydroxyglutarate oxidase [Planctomycetota bacterium]